MSQKRYVYSVLCCSTLAYAFLSALLFGWSNLVGDQSIEQVVKRQRSHKESLYLSGFRGSAIEYKLELYRNIKPEVIALGSSRSMQVRKSFFNSSFANIGGTVNSLSDLNYMVQKVVEMEPHPKTILLFVDVWWFNSKSSNERVDLVAKTQPNYLSLADADVLAKPILSSGLKFSNNKRLGFGAIYQNQGFDQFGSFHYVGVVTGTTPSSDVRFNETFSRIDGGRSRFEYADNYSATALHQFNNALRILSANHIHTIVIFPPFASMVYDKMESSGNYKYINNLIADLKKTNSLFDFTDPRTLKGVSDCEFIDGFHGGEIVYATILGQISNEDIHLKNALDLNYLSNLNNYRGVSSPETIKIYGSGGSETDFLGLGCQKMKIY